MTFETFFTTATGYAPYDYQRRLGSNEPRSHSKAFSFELIFGDEVVRKGDFHG